MRDEGPDFLTADDCSPICATNTFHGWSSLLYQVLSLVKKSYLVSGVSQEFFTSELWPVPEIDMDRNPLAMLAAAGSILPPAAGADLDNKTEVSQ